MDNRNPEIESIKLSRGIAGQCQYTATVRYPNEEPSTVAFVGSTYGSPGPVVMITDAGQTFVSSPDRFGARFDRSWVKAFFGVQS